mgnify:CR=1 FL=1
MVILNPNPLASNPEINSQTADTELSANHWSPSLQHVLDRPAATLPLRLMLGGMVFSLAFVVWAWLGQIEEVGHATGQLVPRGEVYKIHPVELGKVASVDVKEGERVKAGQVLVKLDTQLAASEVLRLEQILVGYKTESSQKQILLEKSRLEAQTRGAIALADRQAQTVAIAQASAKAQGQKSAIAQVRAKMVATNSLLTQLQSDAQTHQERLNRLKPLLSQGAISQENIFQADQTLRDRQRSITQSQGELQQAAAETEHSQADFSSALAESQRLQAELNRKQAEGQMAQLETQQRIQQLEVEFTQIKAKITETKNLLNSAQEKLKQRSLYAPIDGVVSSLNVRNPGEVMQPGQTIAEIAPEDAPLVLLAKLPNREAGFIKTGMAVKVKLDAYPYQDYGIVEGKVASISPDTKLDERLGIVYRVEVVLSRNHINANRQILQLKTGATGTADIIIRRRRIVDVLLEPIAKLQKGGLN